MLFGVWTRKFEFSKLAFWPGSGPRNFKEWPQTNGLGPKRKAAETARIKLSPRDGGQGQKQNKKSCGGGEEVTEGRKGYLTEEEESDIDA